MVFDVKYAEFCEKLLGLLPESADQIRAALALSPEERRKQFRDQVLDSCSPKRDAAVAPAYVLPGVPMLKEVWEVISAKSKKAIQEYLTVLSFTCLLETSSAADLSGSQWNADWAKTMFDDMKSKMSGIDFAGMAEKMASIFGEPGKNGIPQLPEKFLKGQIARLAEEIVKEFRLEDFGIDPAAAEAAGNDPTKALNLMMDVFMKNPANLQKTIARLGKKLQEKIQSGSLRPQELVAEAEELMKTFSENPAFVEMMETFRQTFGMQDPELARAAGQEQSARLSLVKERLRKKLDAKKKASGKQ
jgi:hypothetical protein